MAEPSDTRYASRNRPGALPCDSRKAEENALSDEYPTSDAISLTVIDVVLSSFAARDKRMSLR